MPKSKKDKGHRVSTSLSSLNTSWLIQDGNLETEIDGFNGSDGDDNAKVIKTKNTYIKEPSVSASKNASLSKKTKIHYKRFYFIALVLGFLIGIIFVQVYFYPSVLTILREHPLFDMLSMIPSSPKVYQLLQNITQTFDQFLNIFDSSDIYFHKPGRVAHELGWKAHYPVVIIPGLTSSGLEVWKGKDCSHSYFRSRIWGSWDMFKILLLDFRCWIEHIMLDEETGLDPDGIKLRPAEGLEAADFFCSGYWIWDRILDALGHIGYDRNNIHMAAYDWRLSMEGLEERDNYFSKLQNKLEFLLKMNHGVKAVVVTHSLGSITWNYFMKWVESDKGGKGGSNWVSRHIHSVFHIGGSFLGTSKLIPSLISGEMKDTAELGLIESFLLESVVSKRDRAKIFRHWPGLLNLFPRGGSMIWGKDIDFSGNYLSNDTSTLFTIQGVNGLSINYTTNSILELLQNTSLLPEFVSKRISDLSTDFFNDTISEEMKDNPKYWVNPFTYTLPNASNMTIYCNYGIGLQTEKGYYYSFNEEIKNEQIREAFHNGTLFTSRLNDTLDSKCMKNNYFEDSPIIIDRSMNDPERSISNGVRYMDGDGTITVISAGFMSAIGWESKNLNPYSIKTFTREYPHVKLPLVKAGIRGGPTTSDHVDILGNYKLTVDLLQLVSANEDLANDEYEPLKDRIYSNILNIL